MLQSRKRLRRQCLAVTITITEHQANRLLNTFVLRVYWWPHICKESGAGLVVASKRNGAYAGDI
jgi:hypothetical protein